MFASPAELTLEWRQSGVEGSQRFLRKLFSQVADLAQLGTPKDLDLSKLTPEQRRYRHELHVTIDKVTDDIGRRQTFNTAIAAIMELLNLVSKFTSDDEQSIALRHEIYSAVVLMLYPITPHICFKLWKMLGHTNDIDTASWPKVDPEALKADEITLVVQVNGKVRSRVNVDPNASESDVIATVLAKPEVMKFTDGKSIKKTIYVKGRLVNIVVA